MSDGNALVEFLLGDRWLHLEVYVGSTDITILLELPYMEKLALYFKNLDNRLVHAPLG